MGVCTPNPNANAAHVVGIDQKTNRILMSWLYWYCTDFCINAANLLGVSYAGFNFCLFIIGIPAFLLMLFGLNVYRYRRFFLLNRL